MKINPHKLRKTVLDMVYKANSGHIGGSFSIAEAISVLYSNYDIGGKDKLILSKGHAVPIIYAVLYEIGKITKEELDTFREIDSRLQGHPDKVRFPLVDATTGSLGQGLSIAMGHALAKKLKGEDGKVFCILGDGEMQEGQIWESIMSCPRLRLKNLVCIVDWNKYQNEGQLISDKRGTYDEIVKSFTWQTYKCDGHKVLEIEKCLKEVEKAYLPSCIFLDTTKGYPISFMQTADWHAKAPNKDEYELALEELKELGV